MAKELDAIEAFYADRPADGFADTIILSVEAHLSLQERMLLLFRPLIVKARIDCENAPGKTASVSLVNAARWRWPWQYNGAYEARSEAYR